MMIDDMRNVRNMLKERIHIALATNNPQLANDLLVQYNTIHWQIRNLEETMYHVQDLKHDLAEMECAS